MSPESLAFRILKKSRNISARIKTAFASAFMFTLTWLFGIDICMKVNAPESVY